MLTLARELGLRVRTCQVTRIRNRVGHGVRPGCRRTFENLRRHRTNQHPGFAGPRET